MYWKWIAFNRNLDYSAIKQAYLSQIFDATQALNSYLPTESINTPIELDENTTINIIAQVSFASLQGNFFEAADIVNKCQFSPEDKRIISKMIKKSYILPSKQQMVQLFGSEAKCCEIVDSINHAICEKLVCSEKERKLAMKLNKLSSCVRNIDNDVDLVKAVRMCECGINIETYDSLVQKYPDYKIILKNIREQEKKLKDSLIFWLTSGAAVVSELELDKQIFTVQQLQIITKSEQYIYFAVVKYIASNLKYGSYIDNSLDMIDTDKLYSS